jgi:general stress protein YciG
MPSIRKEQISETDSDATVTNVSDLTQEQRGAIRRAESLGAQLQEDLGEEIVCLYQGGVSQPAIAEELEICTKYGVTKDVAKSAIHLALCGTMNYTGMPEDVEQYAGLLEGDELDLLAKQHNQESGKRLYEMKKGIYAMTPEERSEASRKGGTIGGNAIYEMKKGVHAMSHEELSEAGSLGGKTVRDRKMGIFAQSSEEIRKAAVLGGKASYEMKKGIHAMSHEELIDACSLAGKTAYEMKKGVHAMSHEELSAAGRKGAVTQGYAPWSGPELEQLANMMVSPEYSYDGGSHKGRPNLNRISQSLNQIFHSGEQIRSAVSVKRKLHKLKKATTLLRTKEEDAPENLP